MEELAPPPRSASRLPPAALLIAGLVVVVQLVAGPRYGLFRDELYYLACADHLDWGYVDQPPLSIVVLAAVRALLGDGLLAVRLVPALLDGLLVLLGARLARELGGGARAAGLTALAVAIVPQYLGICGFYSMNAFDLVFWSVAALLLARLAATEEPRLWLPLGLVLGIGLQNKISLLFFGFGLAIAVLATPLRRQLARWQLWAGAGIALALFSPYLIWQLGNGWPTLEFMANAARYKNAPLAPGQFLLAQLVEMHPLTAPLWVGGLAWLLAARAGRRFRPLGVVYLAVLAVMLATRSKPYYLAGAYPMLLAAGAVAFERLLAPRALAWPLPAAAALLALGGAATAPLAIPLLPVERYVAYQRALGLAPAQAERQELGPLPQHFADRFGWRELAAAVAAAYRQLSPADQREVLIVARNYGEAGAINYYGRAFGLPRAVSQHNSFYLWGPGRERVTIAIVVGMSVEDLADAWESLEEVGRVVSPWAMPFETADPILIARGLKMSVDEAWRAGKLFI